MKSNSRDNKHKACGSLSQTNWYQVCVWWHWSWCPTTRWRATNDWKLPEIGGLVFLKSMSNIRWNITNQEVCTRLGWLKNKDTKLVGMEWKLNLWRLGRDEYKLNAMCKIHGCNKIYLKDVISLKESYWLHTIGKHWQILITGEKGWPEKEKKTCFQVVNDAVFKETYWAWFFQNEVCYLGNFIAM